MGRIRAVFKADGAETGGRYSISEWWLEPNTKGPGAHSHPEDDVFYVIEGTMSCSWATDWIDAPPARSCSFPAASTHDFENRSDGAPAVPQPLLSGRLRAPHAGHRRSGSPSIRRRTPTPDPRSLT